MWDSKIKTSLQERKYLIIALVIGIVVVGLVVFGNRGKTNTETRNSTSSESRPETTSPVNPPTPVSPAPAPVPEPSPAPAPVSLVDKNLNALYIGTAQNTVSGREEEALFFYNSDDYTSDAVGSIYFLDSQGEGNFDRMQNPKLIHQFNTQFKYRFFSWDKVENKLLVSLTRTGVNEVYSIDLDLNSVKKIWQRNLGDNKYTANAKGAGAAKFAAFGSDQYVFVFFDHKFLLVLNTTTGNERYLGNYGDPQIDFETNKLSAAPYQPGDGTEPSGARQEFDLP